MGRPAAVRPQGTVLAGGELAAFRAQKARIDRMISGQTDQAEVRQLAAAAPQDGKTTAIRR